MKFEHPSLARRPTLVAVAFALAFSALIALVLATPDRRARAQETDLPGVSADSIDEDFLKGHAPGQAPAVSALPAAPAAPRAPEDARTEAFRRRIHAGDNDVVQVGHDVVVERGEHVLGHVFAMGGNVTIKGVVDDDVVAMGGDVVLEDGAMVRGDIVSLGGTVRKAKTATVLGSNVTVGGLPRGFFDFRTLDWFGNGVRLMTALMTLALWLFLGWIIVLATPDRSRRILATIGSQPALACLWGFLGLVALAPLTVAVALAAVLLVVTIIGIPVAVLLLLGYVLAIAAVIVWGGVLGASALGEWIVLRLSPRLGEPSLVRNTIVGMLTVGLFSVTASMFGAMGAVLPPAALLGNLLGVLGRVIHVLATFAGIGGVLRARAGQIEPLRMPWGGGSPVMSVPATPPAPPAAPAAPL